MKRGCFCKKNTFEIINPEDIEKELPESFLVDSMKKYKYPKYEYICLLGLTCCGDSSYIDRILIDIILYDSILYHDTIEFLCNRYSFICCETI